MGWLCHMWDVLLKASSHSTPLTCSIFSRVCGYLPHCVCVVSLQAIEAQPAQAGMEGVYHTMTISLCQMVMKSVFFRCPGCVLWVCFCSSFFFSLSLNEKKKSVYFSINFGFAHRTETCFLSKTNYDKRNIILKCLLCILINQFSENSYGSLLLDSKPHKTHKNNQFMQHSNIFSVS